MNPAKIARVAGLLFLITFVTAIPAVFVPWIFPCGPCS